VVTKNDEAIEVSNLRVMVDVPITSPSFPSDIHVPETMIEGVLGVMVVPAMTMPVSRTGASLPALVMTVPNGGIVGANTGMVVVPICNTDSSKDTDVPSILKPELPGASVFPAATS